MGTSEEFQSMQLSTFVFTIRDWHACKYKKFIPLMHVHTMQALNSYISPQSVP